MADEPKQPWYKSVPGMLTAATGFVAALSGLVAGLNQLGAFKRAPAPVTVSAPAPPQSAGTAGGSSSSATPAGPEMGGPLVPVARAPSAGARSPTPTVPAPAAPPATPRPATDTTTARVSRLPKGALLELAVSDRICAPAEGRQRFTARLTSPVKSGGATVLPTGTTAVLRLRRGGSSGPPEARLDSLVGPQVAAAIPSSSVRIRRGAAGDCLRADARLAARLGAPVVLPRP